MRRDVVQVGLQRGELPHALQRLATLRVGAPWRARLLRGAVPGLRAARTAPPACRPAEAAGHAGGYGRGASSRSLQRCAVACEGCSCRSGHGRAHCSRAMLLHMRLGGMMVLAEHTGLLGDARRRLRSADSPRAAGDAGRGRGRAQRAQLELGAQQRPRLGDHAPGQERQQQDQHQRDQPARQQLVAQHACRGRGPAALSARAAARAPGARPARALPLAAAGRRWPTGWDP